MKRLSLLLASLFSLLASFSGLEGYAQVRETNHSTAAERAFWRLRAGFDGGSPKYKAKHDVVTNSPGDWDRIVANKNTWIANKAADRYTNYFKGCSTCQFPRADLKNNINPYDSDAGFYMKDAAFWAYITNDAAVKSAVRDEIINFYVNATYSYTSSTGQVTTGIKAFDFSNVQRWVPNTFGDINPGFRMADVFWKVLESFQYTSATGSAYSDNDKAAINKMMKGAGYFFKSNYDITTDALFTNRAAQTYIIRSTGPNPAQYHESNPGNWAVMYTDASGVLHRTRYVSKNYANRRVTIAHFVGEVGTHLSDSVLVESCQRFFEETIRFAVYPVGAYTDYLRQEPPPDENPGKGFDYAHGAIVQVIQFADTRARVGDTRLYDYEDVAGTTAVYPGSDPSSDGSTKKSLKHWIMAMCKSWNHQAPALYGTESPAKATGTSKNNYLIDGTNEITGHKAVWFSYFAQANVYYQDSYIDQTVLNTAPGAQGYPPTAQTYGSRDGWTAGVLPGPMLMFAQRLGTGPVPYPGSISLTPQTITFAPISDVTYGAGTVSLSATAPGGTVVFSTSDVAKATVSGSTLTFKNAGNVTIYANQGGNGTYAAAPTASQSFTISKKVLTVTATNVSRPYNTANPNPFPLSFSGFISGQSNSVLTTQPTATTTATLSSNAGTYAIVPSGGSSGNYSFSYVNGTLTITAVTAQQQYVRFNNLSTDFNKLTTSPPWTVSATAYDVNGNPTGAPITYANTSGPTHFGIASITSGGLVTLTGIPDIGAAVTATAAATGNYASASQGRNINITAAPKTAQTITFTQPAAKTWGDGAFTLAPTASSGLTVSLAIASGPATIVGYTITLTGTGPVVVVASQAGDNTYQIAPDVQRTITVNKAPLSVTADDKTRIYGLSNPVFTLAYSGFVLGETSAVFTSLPTATTAAVPTSSVGNYAIVPSGGSVSNYSLSYTNGTLSITQAGQSITFPTIADKGQTEVPFNLNATASSGLAVSYSIVSGPATVSGNSVTLTGSAGTVTVRAAQAGNINYTAASTVDRSFDVIAVATQQNQTITVADPGTKVYAVGSTFDISATSNSGLAVTTTVVSGPGTILGSTVTITGAGSIVLKSVQAGDADYFAASDVFTTVVVNKATQVISSAVIADKYISDPTFAVSATASSALTVTLTANNKLTQNTATTFTPLALGQAIITATQAGNANYLATALTLTFNILPSPVTGTVDLLAGLSPYPSAYKVGTGTAAYWQYNLSWPTLGGAFTTTRLVLETGTDAAGNVIKGNILDNFKLYRWNGSAYVLVLDVTGNTTSNYDVILPGVTITDKLYLTSRRDIRSKRLLRKVMTYGESL